MYSDRRVYLARWTRVENGILADALDWCGGWDRMQRGARVLIKPNLTFPFHEPGVTTPPDMLRALTEMLVTRGAVVTICEGGPSLDAYSTWGAFREHGILDLEAEFGIRVIDLCSEPAVHYDFGRETAGQRVPVPRILAETDVFVSMPVVKVHAMTTVSLALKNQWGLIPSKKRFLLHSAIDDILVGLNAMLPHPLVVCDARMVLDGNGPMFGTPRPGNFLAVSNDPGAFDVAITHLMGFDPMRIKHIRAAIKAGLAPRSPEEIHTNTDILAFRPFQFRLRRTIQNYVALVGFKYRIVGRLGYDSVLSGLLHKILYAVKGNPLHEAVQARRLQGEACSRSHPDASA